MSTYRFSQVDVFGSGPLRGNPVAVVHAAQNLDGRTMQAFASWTNLSETTFLLPPTQAGADYRVRIFTPGRELPFAGHPTLGSAHAWLAAGGVPGRADVVVQECGLGLVEVRRGERLGFAAPPLLRSGEAEPEVLEQARRALGVDAGQVLRAAWADNGPGWLGLQLRDAATVLALEPDTALMRPLNIGVLGEHDAATASRLGASWEVRAFAPVLGEDPVTGSLNASLATWLQPLRVLPAEYVARQGTALGRDGRVHVERRGEVTWVSGDTRTVLDGTADL